MEGIKVLMARHRWYTHQVAIIKQAFGDNDARKCYYGFDDLLIKQKAIEFKLLQLVPADLLLQIPNIKIQ